MSVNVKKPLDPARVESLVKKAKGLKEALGKKRGQHPKKRCLRLRHALSRIRRLVGAAMLS